VDYPTLVHDVALAHEMLLRMLSGAPLALGIDWISQI